MPQFNRNLLKYSIDEGYFKKWSRQMAYILGFSYADGCIYKTSLSWDIQKRDLNLLKKINNIINSNYPISIRRNSCRLRVSNQIFINHAIRRGLFPKKNIRKTLPGIPKHLVRHFVRGYLDGDGWIVLRNGRNEVDVGFANGGEDFLKRLRTIIEKYLNITSGKVRKKVKITPRGFRAIAYQLDYYSSNAIKVINWMYDNLTKKDLYLNRKYEKYLEAMNLNNFLTSGTKKVRIIQKDFGKSMKTILRELFNKQKLNGVQIAEILGVHSSSVYRWLAKNGVKYPMRRVKKNLWTNLWN